MATIERLTDLIRGKVRDAAADLVESDYLTALAEALKTYGRHRPRHLVADLPGNGSNDLPLPADWSDGVSSVVSIEYPVGQVPEILFDHGDWGYYRSPAGLQLRLLTAAPAVGESVRLLYTTLHTEATIPVIDEEAVANLAAAVCLRQLAARYAQTSDPTIAADVVNYRTKADEYRRLADSYDGRYRSHLGLKDTDTVPAAMVVAAPASGGRTRLTHGRS